jgi:putative endonuclease
VSSEAGDRAEEAAARHLLALGYEILARNFRSRVGEIDIVARDGETVVFVEVRARGSSAYGLARETVGYAKRRRIIKTAQVFAQSRMLDCPLRFDVVAFETGLLEHIPDAFSADGF